MSFLAQLRGRLPQAWAWRDRVQGGPALRGVASAARRGAASAGARGWARARLGGWELVGRAGGGQGGHQTLGGSGGGGAGKVFEEIYSDLRLREGHPSRGRVYKNFPAC